jgi:enoyl-CoA hydratase/carnithine racemase
MAFDTLSMSKEGAVLFVEINAPPMNLIGPELVHDLVSLISEAESDVAAKVLVFKSTDPDYFISHVDLNRVAEYRHEAATLTGEASLGLLFRRLSTSRLVTIAQIEGRVRAAGSEFVLACDMRFAALESAIFSQFEAAFGLLPGGGAAQHLTRLIGRGRALEVMLSAQDYSAELAERYGWINRALPVAALGDFVRALAQRIASFPASGHAAVKNRVNAIALASVEDFRRDSDAFGNGARARDSSADPSGNESRLPDPGRRDGSGPNVGRLGALTASDSTTHRRLHSPGPKMKHRVPPLLYKEMSS